MERTSQNYSNSRAHSVAPKKGTVLILEDFDGIRALLSAHFKRQGYEVDSAATLSGALTVSHEHEPKVLFVDYDLSTENPYLAIQTLHQALPQSKIVLIGGPLAATDKQRAINAGANRIMEKEYDLTLMDELAEGATTPNNSYQFATAV